MEPESRDLRTHSQKDVSLSDTAKRDGQRFRNRDSASHRDTIDSRQSEQKVLAAGGSFGSDLKRKTNLNLGLEGKTN